MSQYATTAELYVYGVPSAALVGVAAGTITAALVAASAVADSYIPSRYSPPLTAWGADLTQAVAKIAAWDLLVHARGVSADDPGVATLKESRDDSIKWLRDVQAGRAQLNQAATAPAVIAAPRVITNTQRTRWQA